MHELKQIKMMVKEWEKRKVRPSSTCSGDIMFSLESGTLPEGGQATSYDLLKVQAMM